MYNEDRAADTPSQTEDWNPNQTVLCWAVEWNEMALTADVSGQYGTLRL